MLLLRRLLILLLIVTMFLSPEVTGQSRSLFQTLFSPVAVRSGESASPSASSSLPAQLLLGAQAVPCAVAPFVILQSQVPTPSTVPAAPTLATLSPSLAAERLAALPALKAKLLAQDKTTDLTIIITPALLNKLLQTLQGQTFKVQNLFTLTIQSGQTQLYHGLTLAQLHAELATNNALLSVKQTLAITARLIISTTPAANDQPASETPTPNAAQPPNAARTATNEMLTAKLQVIEIRPIVANSALQETIPSINPMISTTNTAANHNATTTTTAQTIAAQNPKAAPDEESAAQPVGPNSPTPEIALPPETLTALLPPLQLPLSLDFDQTVQFEPIKQQKPLAFEATLEARQLAGKFEITGLLPLENRLVLRAQIRDLRIKRVAPPRNATQVTGTTATLLTSPVLNPHVPRPNTNRPTPQSTLLPVSTLMISQTPPPAPTAPTALDQEITQLAANLNSNKELSLRLARRFLARLLTAYAQASTQDLLIKLLPARLFTSQSDLGFAQYENYLDIEAGQGTIDLRDADLSRLQNGQGQCLVDLTGQFQGQARGRQLGINYTTTPQVNFTLKDQFPFLLEKTAQGYQIRPVNKAVTLQLKITVPVPQLGTSLKLNREIVLQTSNLLRPFPLPTIYTAGLQLPDKRSLTLIDLDYLAAQDQLWLGANLKISNAPN